jgi:hypothetical protein
LKLEFEDQVKIKENLVGLLSKQRIAIYLSRKSCLNSKKLYSRLLLLVIVYFQQISQCYCFIEKIRNIDRDIKPNKHSSAV